jgi:protoheme IX farnesyltransferase
LSDLSIRNERVGTAALLREGGRVADFVELLKPRVMSLVVFTGAAGLVVAPSSVHPVLAAVAILCIAVGAGASGAINMWYERDIDALMARTAGRPLPTGRIEPAEALAFGVILSLFSVMVMGLALNWVAAALLALAIGFYVFVYTIWLKRRTPQNIVIGGAAGAFPPMIGWAAATGEVGLASIALFALIFFWTPPHFWALALVKAGDYARAGVPMLPVVAGARETKRQMLIYTLILCRSGSRRRCWAWPAGSMAGPRSRSACSSWLRRSGSCVTRARAAPGRCSATPSSISSRCSRS